MKVFIVILSILFLSSCSTYERIKENANDAYEWSKDTAKDTVEEDKEVIAD